MTRSLLPLLLILPLLARATDTTDPVTLDIVEVHAVREKPYAFADSVARGAKRAGWKQQVQPAVARLSPLTDEQLASTQGNYQ